MADEDGEGYFTLQNGLWVARIANMVAVVCSFAIFVSECKYRLKLKKEIQQNNNEQNQNQKNIYLKLLNIWSMMVLFMATLTNISYLTTTLPLKTLCPFFLPTQCGTFVTTKAFFTFYQISRLQYCFLSKQVHSQKYGYSAYTLNFVYIMGAILTLYGNIACYGWSFTTNTEGEKTCEWKMNHYHLIIGQIWIPVYFVWDVSVLCLYFYKIYQIHSKTSLSDITYKKVRFILQKITALTILYEIGSGCALSLYTFIPPPEYLFLQDVMRSIDMVWTSSIMWLMIEYHNDKYLKLLNYFGGCCCKSMIKHHLENIEEEKQLKIGRTDALNKQKSGHDTLCDTASNDLPMEHSDFIDQSELTMTVNTKSTSSSIV